MDHLVKARVLIAEPRCPEAVLAVVALVLSASCGEVDPQLADAQPVTDTQVAADGGPDPAPIQRVVVLADDDSTYKATLYALERAAAGWSEIFSHPVTIGKNGLAWGVGLHDPADIPAGATVKQEGDGRSPMGRFALTRSWGYLQPASVKTKLPYTTATATVICVDDVTSSYYNQVIDWQAEGLAAGSLPSHEAMLLSSDVYKYTIFVAHNSPEAKAGAGSCIFLHLWSDADGYTAGCTAMAEADMLRLLGWLDPARAPQLVQLTRSQYARLKDAWGLPTIPVQ